MNLLIYFIPVVITEKSFPSSADVAQGFSSSKLQEFANRRLHRDYHRFGSRETCRHNRQRHRRCTLLQIMYAEKLVDNRRRINAALFENKKAPSMFDRYKDVFGHGGDGRGKRVIRKSEKLPPNYYQVFRCRRRYS